MLMPEQIEQIAIAELVPYAQNARTHDTAQVAQIAKSMEQFGWTNPVLVNPTNGIIAGHGRVLAAELLGMETVPCIRVVGLTADQERALILADNKLALNAGWDEEVLAAELRALTEAGFEVPLIGWDEDELAKLFRTTTGETDEDAEPPLPSTPTTKIGDVWELGAHVVANLDSTSLLARELFGTPDLVLTDPPYCSGGFQESSKSVGSVGTTGKHKQIANDRLSTRGYQALIKAAVFGIDAGFFYVFTDWRMWTYLFDLSEASGAGVRSMIVWNKGTPGMGLGWRAQHELVLWAAKVAPPYPKSFSGNGNVLSLSRQRNDLHTTQKPVELLENLIACAPWVKSVADPFTGSGSTLIACEKAGVSFAGCELDASYVDVAVTRWQEFTGRTATLRGDGRTFAQIVEERACAVS